MSEIRVYEIKWHYIERHNCCDTVFAKSEAEARRKLKESIYPTEHRIDEVEDISESHVNQNPTENEPR